MDRAERAFQNGDLIAAVQLYDRAVRRAPWDRALLIRFLETVLLARERAEDRETEYALDAVLEKRLHSLRWLTGGHDPLFPSLQAWRAALWQEKENALAFLVATKTSAPFSITRLRIAGKVARLLDDRAMEEAIRAELMHILPLWWDDPIDPRGRILRKEHPWLEEFGSPSP